MNLNWQATTYFVGSLETAINKLENDMKTTSRLVMEAKLEAKAVEYFTKQMEEQRQAIIQLKKVYEAVTAPVIPPVETSV